jgi:methylation protein EvaC
MAVQFRSFADAVKKDHLRAPDPFVVEIGSNDGIMLQHFAKPGIRHLGVEPSANVARVAQEKGLETICRFFGEELARDILSQHGPADVILGANVFCHLPYLHSVAVGIEILLKPQGVVVFEEPYLGDIVEKVSYDQIYDEHAFYFSLASVRSVFREHGLDVIHVELQPVHGGSMRYVLAREGTRQPTPAVETQRAREEELGLRRAETYESLRTRIEGSRAALLTLLHDVRGQGKRVAGYGATSKSTTVINYCQITTDLVEFISDNTPVKQGKLSPGMHIPIHSQAEFRARYPDYAVLFAWNHAREILGKEQAFQEAGGRWIVYVPRVEILSETSSGR